MVFSVVFTAKFAGEEDVRKFLAGFKKLQEYCKQNEPGTLTYELHERFVDGKPAPHEYAVIERYNSIHDFENVHTQSAAFKEFFAFVGTLNVLEKSLSTYFNESVEQQLAALPSGAPHGQSAAKGVLVFCGSRLGASAAYAEAAEALGRHLAQHSRRPLVYGGGTVGLMGKVASATRLHGGYVISVIPRPLCPREASGDLIGDRIYFTNTMAERKSIMFALADTVVALPGGLGTFDELFEALTLVQLNACQCRIGVLNISGFFDPFLAMVGHLVQEGFLNEHAYEYFVVKDNVNELMEALQRAPLEQPNSAKLTWPSRP